MLRSVWRHWGCVTPKVLQNVKEIVSSAEDIDGFEDLTPDAQEKILKAWEDGHVADEDIPESARKADGDAEDDEEEDGGKKKAKKGKGAAAKSDKGVFKLEYAASSRSKCKVCSGAHIVLSMHQIYLPLTGR